jgi:hypothetical protein
LAAFKSGAIDVDFRPLLMSYKDVVQAISTMSLGTITEDNPQIADPQGEFVLELRVTTRKKIRRMEWIGLRLSDGQFWPNFIFSSEPVRIAVGKDRRVLIVESNCILSTFDIATTQVLNRYMKHSPGCESA